MRYLSSRDHGYRIGNSASRATIPKVDDTKVLQEHTLNGYSDESHAAIETFSNYGFTSVVQPPTGEGDNAQHAEAVVSYLGGNRSHGVVVAHGDRRYRLYKLANGEVAMHDDQGQQVHFRRDGLYGSVPNSKKIVMQVMQSDTLPQDGNTVKGQTLGQIQQAGRSNVSSLTMDKNNLTITVPGTITFNAADINLVASDGVFTVGHTYLGVDQVNEKPSTKVPDVGGDPSKQTYVKIA